MVEGDAENLLLPAVAKVIERPLHKYGVSIVNVGSTAYKRYARIFQRKDNQQMGIPVAIVTDLDVRSIEYYSDDSDEERRMEMLHVTDDVKAALTEICASVDFSELPEYVKTKSEFNEYLTRHKNAGSRVVKKQERDEANQYFVDNRTEITAEAISYIRQNKAEVLAAYYPKGEIKLFAAKNWTLEYEIAKSGLYKELDIAVKMAKGEQAGKVTFEDAKKETDETYKDGTNDTVAYQIFKPINDGAVSKAIVAQYLAEIIESHPKEYKAILESDKHLEYLVKAIKHVTPERV